MLPAPRIWRAPQSDLPAIVAVATHMAPVVPEVPAVCVPCSTVTPEGGPVTMETLVVASSAVLPDPIAIMLDVPPITADILTVLPELVAITTTILAVLAEVTPVVAHTLEHLSAVLSTRARDPECHSH
jgi:hypothetical protein